MAENFIIKNSSGKGKGMFSTINIDKNQVIFRIDGINIKKEQIEDFSGSIASNYLQVGKELYLVCEEHPGFFINHSCSPNSYIKIAVNQAFVISLYPIKPGQEITFDYSTTSTETPDTWSMKCECSNYICRKLITGFSSVPDDIKKQYIASGMVPKYVLNYFDII